MNSIHKENGTLVLNWSEYFIFDSYDGNSKLNNFQSTNFCMRRSHRETYLIYKLNNLTNTNY